MSRVGGGREESGVGIWIFLGSGFPVFVAEQVGEKESDSRAKIDGSCGSWERDIR